MSANLAAWITGVSTAAMAALVGFQAMQTQRLLEAQEETLRFSAAIGICAEWAQAGRALDRDLNFQGWTLGDGFNVQNLGPTACASVDVTPEHTAAIDKLEALIARASLVLPEAAGIEPGRLLGQLYASSAPLYCAGSPEGYLAQKKIDEISKSQKDLMGQIVAIHDFCNDYVRKNA